MRIGHHGFLVLTVALGGFAGLGWIGYQALQKPEFHLPPPGPGDGARAQRKIYALAGRKAGHGTATAPIVLTQGELNEFLARHFGEAAAIPFTDIGLRLAGDGTVDCRGRLPLAHLVTERPLSGLAGLLPPAWLERLVWLRIRARIHLEPATIPPERRYLRLDVREFAVGRQRFPASLLRFLLDPRRLRVLRWPVPGSIEAITIEADQVVIRFAS